MCEYTFFSFFLYAKQLRKNYVENFISQRPIVEFSLENRLALKAREKRMEKSKEKNPLWKKNTASTSVKGGKLFPLIVSARVSVKLQFLFGCLCILHNMTIITLHLASTIAQSLVQGRKYVASHVHIIAK